MTADPRAIRIGVLGDSPISRLAIRFFTGGIAPHRPVEVEIHRMADEGPLHFDPDHFRFRSEPDWIPPASLREQTHFRTAFQGTLSSRTLPLPLFNRLEEVFDRGWGWSDPGPEGRKLSDRTEFILTELPGTGPNVKLRKVPGDGRVPSPRELREVFDSGYDFILSEVPIFRVAGALELPAPEPRSGAIWRQLLKVPGGRVQTVYRFPGNDDEPFRISLLNDRMAVDFFQSPSHHGIVSGNAIGLALEDLGLDHSDNRIQSSGTLHLPEVYHRDEREGIERLEDRLLEEFRTAVIGKASGWRWYSTVEQLLWQAQRLLVRHSRSLR